MAFGFIFGIIGALLVMVGVFLPIVSLPVWGSISLMSLQQNVALVLMLVAALHLLCCVKRWWWGLYVTKLGTVAALVWATFQNWDKLSGPTTALGKIVGSVVKEVVKVQYGVGVLAAGILILIAANVPRPKKIKPEDRNEAPPKPLSELSTSGPKVANGGQ
jgi:hypothetical protein